MWRALPPIVIGHTAAIGATVLIALLAGMVMPLDTLRMVVAATLVTTGVYRLWRHWHPRFGGMQVGFGDLTAWSFLMATGHGAGLMVLPFVISMPADLSAAGGAHASHVASGN